MLRAVLLIAAGSACEAFRATAVSASGLQSHRAARSARAPAVAMGDYSLDNMVLDGPLIPLRDQVRSCAGPHNAT